MQNAFHAGGGLAIIPLIVAVAIASFAIGRASSDPSPARAPGDASIDISQLQSKKRALPQLLIEAPF